MILAYTLTMPGRGSWNGGWSGDDGCHVATRSYRTSAPMIGSYRYAWEDGWAARIEVREVTAAEAAKLRRKSDGFCGYDWMIDSIERHGAIYASHEELAASAKGIET